MTTLLPTDANTTPNYTPDEHATFHNELAAAHNGIVVNEQAGNYTLVLTDAVNTWIKMTKGTAGTLTFPPDVDVPIPVGACGEGSQWGAGQITLTEGAGVTIRSEGGKKKTAGQFAAFTWLKTAANEFFVTGSLTT